MIIGYQDQYQNVTISGCKIFTVHKYRVTHQVVPDLQLTPKQKLRFSISALYSNKIFVFMSTGGRDLPDESPCMWTSLWNEMWLLTISSHRQPFVHPDSITNLEGGIDFAIKVREESDIQAGAVALGWVDSMVDFDFNVPPCCLAAHPIQPNYHLSKHNRAGNGITKIYVNQTQSTTTSPTLYFVPKILVIKCLFLADIRIGGDKTTHGNR